MGVKTPTHRHTCPKKGCTAQVDNRKFACATDWFKLSKETRDRIHATAALPLTDARRIAAIVMARSDWRDGA